MSAVDVILIFAGAVPGHKKSNRIPRIPEGAVVVATPLNSSFDHDMAAKEVTPSEFGLKMADIEVLLFVERQLNLWTMCCCLCNDKAWMSASPTHQSFSWDICFLELVSVSLVCHRCIHNFIEITLLMQMP